jgi:hypothetical protein
VRKAPDLPAPTSFDLAPLMQPQICRQRHHVEEDAEESDHCPPRAERGPDADLPRRQRSQRSLTPHPRFSAVLKGGGGMGGRLPPPSRWAARVVSAARRKQRFLMRQLGFRCHHPCRPQVTQGPPTFLVSFSLPVKLVIVANSFLANDRCCLFRISIHYTLGSIYFSL